jgi:hypothetical protein
MIAPATMNDVRTPTRSGANPPISGPTTVPAITPVESTPSAHALRALGVCAAMMIIEPDE